MTFFSSFKNVSEKGSDEDCRTPTAIQRKCDKRNSGRSSPDIPQTKSAKIPKGLDVNDNYSNVWIALKKIRRNMDKLLENHALRR